MGEIRIIAGSLRGRKLRVPEDRSVRPTSARAREALFDILGPTLAGLRVLDVYAGSGAFGFEALSRGAADATFLEADREVLKLLRGNAARLGVEERCRIVEGEALSRVASRAVGGPFDVVLSDPPYALGDGNALLRALAEASTLSRAARVVLERDRGSEPASSPPPGLRLVRSARYGRTCLDFYAWTGGEPAPHRGADPRS